jgi:hypothetical protein
LTGDPKRPMSAIDEREPMRPSQGRPEAARRGSLDGAGRRRTNNGRRAGDAGSYSPPVAYTPTEAISLTETAARLEAMARKRPLTWAEVGFRNAGMRATSRAFKFAMGWGLATAELGREPETIDEYAETVGESRATAFRDQQSFRKAFPNEESPAHMNQVSGSQERYNEAIRKLSDIKLASAEAQPIVYSLGASPIT